MRSRVAFACVRRRSEKLVLWDRAVAGDPEALAAVAAWIAEGGIDVAALARASASMLVVPPRRGGADPGAAYRTSRRDLCIAIARFMSSPGLMYPIQPTQVASARYGDFVRDDGAVGSLDRDDDAFGPALVWQARHSRGVAGGRAVIRGWALDAWRAIVRYRRTGPPAMDDPLIARRRSGAEWDARAVRYAAEIGRRAAGIPEGIDRSCGGSNLRRWGDGSGPLVVPEAFFAQLAPAMGPRGIMEAVAARARPPVTRPVIASASAAVPAVAVAAGQAAQASRPAPVVLRALDEFTDPDVA